MKNIEKKIFNFGLCLCLALMKITGTTANPGFAGFDFVNELTFRTRASFTVRASSFTTSLIEDRTFADGEDLDEDGDSDFSSAITVCTDVVGTRPSTSGSRSSFPSHWASHNAETLDQRICHMPYFI
jgi:hypothetical protein